MYCMKMQVNGTTVKMGRDGLNERVNYLRSGLRRCKDCESRWKGIVTKVSGNKKGEFRKLSLVHLALGCSRAAGNIEGMASTLE